ncbi:TRAPP trafficking subunit Trs65-domain-containing protein [Xylariales sp. PMI_506]|nr:TRAPP trafficking subunit Trs65-domain-containing protein [Xylariales sp. PMI_506]
MAEVAARPGSSSSGFGFIEDAALTFFIPLATSFNVQAAFGGDADKSYEDVLESIERRDSLFFDESVDVYLALKTPRVEESTLRSAIKRLVISLEARVVNSSAPDRDTPPASEVIYMGTVQDTDDSFVFSLRGAGKGREEEEDEVEEGNYTIAVWKLSVFLARPRMRLQGPSTIFTPSASLKPAEIALAVGGGGQQDGYLPSGVASGLNLLESFANDPALEGVQPRLSALRVSRVAPLTQNASDLLQPIRTSPRQLGLRIFPAVHSRIRFARPNTTPPSPAIIAMLEVDFTPYFECEIALTSIELSVPDGIVEDLTSQASMALPMSCVAHDHITFLYRIAPENAVIPTLAREPTRDLNITISAVALEQPGVCVPKLTMAWTTTLDFTLPVNPGFGSAMQPIQRAHRPSQLSINNIASLVAPAVARPDSIPSLEAATNKTEAPVPDLGITVTFSAPPATQRIYAGDVFTWSVFVVNRSPAGSTKTPRKLALIAIPKRRRNDVRVNRPPSLSFHRGQPSLGAAVGSGSGSGGGSGGANDNHRRPSRPKTPVDAALVADAVLDDNIVHAMQRSSAVDSAELVCLTADARVGPLAPGACHVVELRFLAVRPGIVGIEAVRVVDLATTEHVDIRELPTMLVQEGAGEGGSGNVGVDGRSGLVAVGA